MLRRLLTRSILLLGLGLLPLAAAAQTQAVARGDAEQVRKVVQAQLDALAIDDAAAAFGYATPAIREQVGTPERFIAMVRAGYPMVYRPSSVSFLEPVLIEGDLAQGVRMADTDGVVWLVVYRLQRQPDKAWRINGCDVLRRFGQVI